ncbi:dienelactone hydrolase family protein [Sphingomonas piscis]|uniref:Dienelactone hydrolase family protein n=1 Tax=Sphingomonas piscis TaxID=2714943 RepID=A0A6G7YNM7_9SPHN|nr:dienelactone hydrolase family protein [Sphingomonas piscis]QIK78350.1 dienelactone hydrolase family protein [Sphingomonas piscis]
MCDSDNNQGFVEDWAVTRRTMLAAGLMAGLSSAAKAAISSVVEKDVSIKTPDGTADAVLFHPAGNKKWPAVLVWPDIAGLRPVFRDMGRRLAAEGYVVLVPNPFYRSKKAPVVDGSFNFGDAKAREQLFGYRAAMEKGVEGDAKAYVAFLDAQPQTNKRRKVGVQGYCMGGPLSFRTAAAAPSRIGAVGSFHGGGLVTDKPDSPHLLIPKTSASYLIAVAKDDDAKEPQAKEVLKRSLASAKRSGTVEVYPANHGWCVPGSQSYDPASAEKAWKELLALYRRALV